jgi:hypothetical protein
MLNDEKMKKGFGDDLATVEKTVEETIKWIDENGSADAETYDNKQKEVEAILMPLVQKAYQSNMPAGGMPGGMPDMGPGPKIEEVD